MIRDGRVGLVLVRVRCLRDREVGERVDDRRRGPVVVAGVRIAGAAQDVGVVEQIRVLRRVRQHFHRQPDNLGRTAGDGAEVARQRLICVTRHAGRAGVAWPRSHRHDRDSCGQGVLQHHVRGRGGTCIGHGEAVGEVGTGNSRRRPGLGEAEVGVGDEADASHRGVVGGVRVRRIAGNSRGVVDVRRIAGDERHFDRVTRSSR